jgi:DNA-binding CsgD family transcriptional regulator
MVSAGRPAPAPAPAPASDSLPAGLLDAALDAALEAVPAAAFLVDGTEILRANGRGRALLADGEERVKADLRAPAHGAGPARLPVSKNDALWIAVFRDVRGEAAHRLPAIAARWKLTPRQTAVLEQVVRGASNRAVAEQLACSEKTIELHVSALLARTRCQSRSELIAVFWTEPA